MNAVLVITEVCLCRPATLTPPATDFPHISSGGAYVSRVPVKNGKKLTFIECLIDAGPGLNVSHTLSNSVLKTALVREVL